MITNFFAAVTAVVTNYVASLTSALTGVTDLFYDATDGWTVLGNLVMIAVGSGLVYFAIRFLLRLIRRA